jgi:site-specific DNA-adenine methylase
VFSQFLKTLGLNNAFVAAYQSMLELSDADLQSVFISYSSEDLAFADRLYDELKRRSVKTWYAPHNMKGGQQIHDQINAAIQDYDRVLLVLSTNSIATFRRKIPGDFGLTAPLCRPGSCRGVQNQLRHERIEKA